MTWDWFGALKKAHKEENKQEEGVAGKEEGERKFSQFKNLSLLFPWKRNDKEQPEERHITPAFL